MRLEMSFAYRKPFRWGISVLWFGDKKSTSPLSRSPLSFIYIIIYANVFIGVLYECHILNQVTPLSEILAKLAITWNAPPRLIDTGLQVIWNAVAWFHNKQNLIGCRQF